MVDDSAANYTRRGWKFSGKRGVRCWVRTLRVLVGRVCHLERRGPKPGENSIRIASLSSLISIVGRLVARLPICSLIIGRKQSE